MPTQTMDVDQGRSPPEPTPATNDNEGAVAAARGGVSAGGEQAPAGRLRGIAAFRAAATELAVLSRQRRERLLAGGADSVAVGGHVPSVVTSPDHGRIMSDRSSSPDSNDPTPGAASMETTPAVPPVPDQPGRSVAPPSEATKATVVVATPEPPPVQVDAVALAALSTPPRLEQPMPMSALLPDPPPPLVESPIATTIAAPPPPLVESPIATTIAAPPPPPLVESPIATIIVAPPPPLAESPIATTIAAPPPPLAELPVVARPVDPRPSRDTVAGTMSTSPFAPSPTDAPDTMPTPGKSVAVAPPPPGEATHAALQALMRKKGDRQSGPREATPRPVTETPEVDAIDGHIKARRLTPAERGRLLPDPARLRSGSEALPPVPGDDNRPDPWPGAAPVAVPVRKGHRTPTAAQLVPWSAADPRLATHAEPRLQAPATTPDRDPELRPIASAALPTAAERLSRFQGHLAHDVWREGSLVPPAVPAPTGNPTPAATTTTPAPAFDLLVQRQHVGKRLPTQRRADATVTTTPAAATTAIPTWERHLRPATTRPGMVMPTAPTPDRPPVITAATWRAPADQPDDPTREHRGKVTAVLVSTPITAAATVGAVPSQARAQTSQDPIVKSPQTPPRAPQTGIIPPRPPTSKEPGWALAPAINLKRGLGPLPPPTPIAAATELPPPDPIREAAALPAGGGHTAAAPRNLPASPRPGLADLPPPAALPGTPIAGEPDQTPIPSSEALFAPEPAAAMPEGSTAPMAPDPGMPLLPWQRPELANSALADAVSASPGTTTTTEPEEQRDAPMAEAVHAPGQAPATEPPVVEDLSALPPTIPDRKGAGEARARGEPALPSGHAYQKRGSPRVPASIQQLGGFAGNPLPGQPVWGLALEKSFWQTRAAVSAMPEIRRRENVFKGPRVPCFAQGRIPLIASELAGGPFAALWGSTTPLEAALPFSLSLTTLPVGMPVRGDAGNTPDQHDPRQIEGAFIMPHFHAMGILDHTGHPLFLARSWSAGERPCADRPPLAPTQLSGRRVRGRGGWQNILWREGGRRDLFRHADLASSAAPSPVAKASAGASATTEPNVTTTDGIAPVAGLLHPVNLPVAGSPAPADTRPSARVIPPPVRLTSPVALPVVEVASNSVNPAATGRQRPVVLSATGAGGTIANPVPTRRDDARGTPKSEWPVASAGEAITRVLETMNAVQEIVPSTPTGIDADQDNTDKDEDPAMTQSQNWTQGWAAQQTNNNDTMATGAAPPSSFESPGNNIGGQGFTQVHSVVDHPVGGWTEPAAFTNAPPAIEPNSFSTPPTFATPPVADPIAQPAPAAPTPEAAPAAPGVDPQPRSASAPRAPSAADAVVVESLGAGFANLMGDGVEGVVKGAGWLWKRVRQLNPGSDRGQGSPRPSAPSDR
ncbi:MAG: hypothetical protein HQL66_10540 [Magnetococcales bacterium]|nr:hypothetical protein [Magnetococcales bacterium]